MIRPSGYARLEEGTVDDQLTAAFEQVDQAYFAPRSLEHVRLVQGNPWHPPSLGSQRVTGTRQRLLLDEKLIARRLPGLRRYNRRRTHGGLSALPRKTPLFTCLC